MNPESSFIKYVCVHAKLPRCVWFFVTLYTVAHQAPLSTGFSRKEYWSGLPCPPPGDLPESGVELTSLMSLALASGFFTTSTIWKALWNVKFLYFKMKALHKWNRQTTLWVMSLAGSQLRRTIRKRSTWPSHSPEPDMLECEVKWALRSITTNRASGGDGIPAEWFQILKDDAVLTYWVLHSICWQIWKTQQWPQDWKRSVFVPVPKKGVPKNVQTTTQLHSSHMPTK